MKKLIIIFALITINNFSFSQTAWTTDPIQTSVFIESLGQFPDSMSSSKIKYGIENAEKIYFTKNSVLYRVYHPRYSQSEIKEIKKEKRRRILDSTYIKPKDVSFYVEMIWEDCNPNVEIQVSEKQDGYFTYGDKKGIKANGYKKLTYINIYNGIDVEYYFPNNELGGIKYNIIVHAGADLSEVKMKYIGTYENISLTEDGDININTVFGNIIDHAPSYTYNGKETTSSFILSNNIVQFKVDDYNTTKDLIIDPWTTTPTSLTQDNLSNLNHSPNDAYDATYDRQGNIYVSGGYEPYKTAKYDINGSLLWTYYWPSNWAPMSNGLPGSPPIYEYSRLTVVPETGSVFIGEGFHAFGGPWVMKVNSDGTLNMISSNFPGNMEIWIIIYNCNTNQLIGFGGGIHNPNNMQMIADTMLSSNVCSNYNGAVGNNNDICSAVMDANGDFYTLISTLPPPSYTGLSDHARQIEKSLFPNYDPANLAFSQPSGYDLHEVWHDGIPPMDNYSVRENNLAVNSFYLYSYDGKTLKVWDKTTGIILDSVVVSPSYNGGQFKTHEGIAVDKCNTVYVAGNNKVHVYHYDGTSFINNGVITNNINGIVYDVQIDPFNKNLIVCGAGFLTIEPIDFSCSEMVFTIDLSHCGDNNGTISIDTIYGAVPPYNYQWSNGDTGSYITDLAPGYYSVTIESESCYMPYYLDTTIYVGQDSILPLDVTVNNICYGSTDGSITAIPQGTPPYSYLWSTGETTPTINNLSVGTYQVTVSDSQACADTMLNIEITSNPQIINNLTATDVNCYGGNDGIISSNTSGGTPGYTYIWNTGDTTQNIQNLISDNYFLTITDAINCTITDSIFVNNGVQLSLSTNINSISCFGYSDGEINITVNGGTSPYSYIWNNTTQNTANVINLAVGTYSVTVTDSNNCSTSISATITEPNILTSIVNSIDVSCSGTSDGQAEVEANGGTPPYNYSWNNGETNNIITNLNVNTYTVTVTDANACTTNNSIDISQSSDIQISYNTTDILCYGNSTGAIDITASQGSNPYTYLWNNQETTEDLANIPAGNYILTVTDSLGCTEIQNIIVNQPNQLVVSLPDNYIHCNHNTEIIASVSGGITPYTYYWNTGDTSTSINYQTNNTQTYSVTVADNNGCVANDNVTITITSVNLEAFANKDTVCPGDPILITTNIIGGVPPYTIYNNGQIVTFPFIAYPNGQENYTLQVVDACDNTNDAIVDIYTHPLPNLSFSADILRGCPPLTVSFNQLAYSGNFEYVWNFDDNDENNLSLDYNPTHIFEQSGLYDITVQVTDSNGCKNQLTIEDMIEVFPKPDAKFYVNEDVVSFINSNIYFENHSIDNYYNFWSFNDGDSSILINPYHNYKYPGIYFPNLVVENEYGCLDTAKKKIEIQDEFLLYVPTAFSPDNDGVNDGFRAVGHGIDLDNYFIAVYDRWGEIIWKTNDLFEEWDGTAKDKTKIVQNGTYKWLVICKDFNGVKHTKSGNVTVIR